jgi:hypothetical protein
VVMMQRKLPLQPLVARVSATERIRRTHARH